MKKLVYICIGLALGLWSACDCTPLYPPEPELEFVSISPPEVEELRDSMVITMRFRDGDGIQEDFANFEVKDLRPTLADSVAKIFYKFPEYTTNTCNPSIQGTITIVVAPTLVFPRNLQTQKTAFSVRLRDAAGNWSNTIETDSITINR
jgi:hypothetical protein